MYGVLATRGTGVADDVSEQQAALKRSGGRF
jgi:hypothetical protein